QRRENADDGNDDEQFNEGECSFETQFQPRPGFHAIHHQNVAEVIVRGIIGPNFRHRALPSSIPRFSPAGMRPRRCDVRILYGQALGSKGGSSPSSTIAPTRGTSM